MYVCINFEVLMQRPTHTVDSLHRWPPRRFSESTAGGGTAIAWMSPCCLVSNGGTCMPKYINILSVSLSVRSTAAKARRPPGLRSLSEQWSVPVILWGSLFCCFSCHQRAVLRRFARRRFFALSGCQLLLFSSLCRHPCSTSTSRD